MPETMSEKKWDRFFELMADILNLPGTWQDKASLVKDEATLRDREDTLEEFVNWFPGESESEGGVEPVA